MKKLTKFYLLIIVLFTLTSCNAFKPKYVDTRKEPINAQAMAKKNVEEGRGVGINNLFRKGTNFEFSSSNPLWRASLNVLDFIPLATVDYSGGVIITEWYQNGNEKDSIKITIRFLSNEISSNSLKITVFKKDCSIETNCSIKELKSKISTELAASILKQASTLAESKK